MAYYLIYLHIACVFLSLSLFIIRGMMQLSGINWRKIKILKILPHLSDTLLLCSGIVMLILFLQNITVWLVLKIISIMLYVFFAAIFFSRKNMISNLNKKKKYIYFITALIFFLNTIFIAYFK
ncbi:SirB2 family protein [Pasteurella multocida]|uniref:SirB2 family protein n=1 Tax=Pasteurella multocida TaxID=747 RepID=UPI0024468453|nr:SirB2 family protein [Pasteurella multocida]MDH3003255.1 hypothetical protein [Pasteurella multocida]